MLQSQSKHSKKLMLRALAWLGPVFATLALAGALPFTFVPNDQPYGYQAPVALSKVNVKDGTGLAFVPWFDVSNFTGELLAAPVSSEGIVDHFGPVWRASQTIDAQNWDLDRRIITKSELTGIGAPFRWDSLNGSQQDSLISESLLNYIRGDRSAEGPTGFRERERLLGDIIHSTPVYVGKPLRGYTLPGYGAFANANRNRPGRVYVGANDGMLHAFDAATGNEEFAYIPSKVLPNIPELAQIPYAHRYFVDGPMVGEDAYFGGAWHTVLVGTLGAGGMGLFALDVTNPVVVSQIDAASRLMWEFTDSDTNILGYTYSRPSVVLLNDDRWAVIIGNGYMSKDGKAALLVIDISDGSLIRQIQVDDQEDNGLSSPAVIDIDGDLRADFAYAGDLNGNLWKFDLTSTNPGDWAPAWDKKPLFVTEYDSTINHRQSITSAPTVGFHPEGGYFVYVATGRLLDVIDGQTDRAVSPQSVYGIWDNVTDDFDLPFESTDLLQQSLRLATHPSQTEAVRTATANAPDWTVHHGWATRLDAGGVVPGTRVLADHVLRDGRVQFVSTDPTTVSGDNYLMQLNAYTGGAPGASVIDVNADGKINAQDNADGNGNGSVEDTAEDRVVGKYLGFGVASSPMIASIGADDAAIVNQVYSVLAGDKPSSDPPADAEDPGLIGGHIDLDTASEIYEFDNGSTDEHVHEWDDKHDSTVVNFFDLIDTGFANIDEVGMPPKQGNRTFILTIANAHLSPGAVIEINGAAQPVKDYRAKMKRYINGNLGPAESFPRYKLTAPTTAESLEGIVQLTDFKISFAKDVIARGGVHPTATGCVRGNEPGQDNEYRNGALTLQALDAENIAGGYTHNLANQAYETGSHAIHEKAYAVSRDGVNDGSLFWEATIFWHWGGGCYGIDDKDSYDANFEEDVGSVDDRGTDADISGDPPPEPEPEPEPEDDGTSGGLPVSRDVTTTRIEGTDLGRLSWRELMIDE